MAEKQTVRKRNSKGGNDKVQAALTEATQAKTSPQEPVQAKSWNGDNGKAESFTEVVGPDQGPQETTQAAGRNGNDRAHTTDLTNVSVEGFAPCLFEKITEMYDDKLVDAELALESAYGRLMEAVHFKVDIVNLVAEHVENGNRDLLDHYRSKYGLRTSSEAEA